MSRLVIMEGWINQKNKNKEICEVYVVLTKSHLKIYKSQINYKQHPEDTIRVLNLSESYNILPMSFDNEFTFSIFKKGEKAMDRLYLHATSKSDYEFWLTQIEGVLNPKTKENDINSANGENSIINEKRLSVDQIDKSSNVRATYNIRNNSLILTDNKELKALQEKYSKIEEEFEKNQKFMESIIKENDKMKKELENCTNELLRLKETQAQNISDNEKIQKNYSQTEIKLQRANDDIRKLKVEKQHIMDKKMGMEKDIENLKKSVKDNNEKEEKQLSQILTDLSIKIHSTNIDLSSYMFCIDNLTDKYKSLSIIESLFKQQLINLVHRCPIDLNTNKTLIDYLTVQIDLSQDSVIQFLSKLITTLANHMSKTLPSNSISDPNLVSIIRNVVTMTKPPQNSDCHLTFHQTSLEIAYLLTKKINAKLQFTNKITDDVTRKIDNQYEAFLKTYKFDSTKKLILIELGEQMKETLQSQLENKENVKKPEISGKSNSILRNCIDKKWTETLKKLDQKDQEINDLKIVIQELSGRILALESSECDSSKSQFSYDEFLNIYSMSAEILCSSCQSQAIELLEMPIIEKMNKVVADFKSYWKSILNIHSLLNLKQKSIFGLRDIFEKMTQSIEDFDSLMKQFSEITHRSIENPVNQKPSPVSNDQ